MKVWRSRENEIYIKWRGELMTERERRTYRMNWTGNEINIWWRDDRMKKFIEWKNEGVERMK